MRHEPLEAISLPGIARAFLWVFLSLFGLLLLLEYATGTPISPQAALLQAAIESTLVTALFAILGAALIGKPLREWIEREQHRVATREEALHRAVARHGGRPRQRSQEVWRRQKVHGWSR